MVGFYRYALALMVLYSHLNFAPWNFGGLRINQGVYAVFCFYIVSGYFTGLIFGRFASSTAQTGRFYVDRVLRIMPAFAAVVAAVTILGLFYHEPKLGPSAGDYREPWRWLQAMLMPFNHIVGMFKDTPYGPFFGVTPVASLAIEMQFFFLFPLFARLPTRAILIIIAAVAAGIVGITFLRSDLLEDYTYRNLSGLLPIFLCGYLLYRHRALSRFDSPVFWIGPVIGAVYLAALIVAAPEHTEHLGENAAALLTCPFLMSLVMLLKSGRTDKLAGYVAYGVFLCHIPIVRVLHLQATGVDFATAALLATAAALAVHFAVERPVLALRHDQAAADVVHAPANPLNSATRSSLEVGSVNSARG